MVTGPEWELNRRHGGNGIGNGNELMGMGGNGKLQPIPAHLYFDARVTKENNCFALDVGGSESAHGEEDHSRKWGVENLRNS